MANKVFGTIKQTDKIELRVQTVQWAGTERYDIRSYNGNYAIKGVTLSKDEILKLKDILEDFFANEEPQKENPVEEANVTPEIKEVPVSSVTTTLEEQKTDDEKIIHSLTSIPVNDCNYPLNTATVEQLRKAVEYMEANPDGQKTRLARCKGRLSKLEKADVKMLLAKTAILKRDKVVAIKPVTSAKEQKEDAAKDTETEKTKTPVIKFPKKDETQIVKLPPSDKHYTYKDVEEKLGKERRIFQGDRDSEYVIDGVLEACVSDQELLDNVMRPGKSYVGAFQYFASKARQGYCMMIGNGNIGVMDANTALKYAIDYFNSEEPKKPEAKRNVTDMNSPKKRGRKKGTKNEERTERKTGPEIHDESSEVDELSE